MRKILRLIILSPFHLIRFIIKFVKYSLYKIRIHTTPLNIPLGVPNKFDLPILPLSESIWKLKRVLTFSIHNIDETKEYWRIIIYPWICQYVTTVFDRWEIIRCFFKFVDMFV